MHWSQYNTLFHTERLGHYCYNALSNTLIELDEAHYGLLEGCREGQSAPGAVEDGFLGLLREKHVLVQAGEEEDVLLVRRHRRRATCFDASTLGLTICPTLRCNFRCPYCFEASQQDGGFMSAATQDRLVEWVAEQEDARSLSVAWYGGEPLLAFDTVCSLTERLRALGLAYAKASMVTNGYLLDGAKIARLGELGIASVQITLDGPREVHDARRVLADGGPTFDRILGNVTALTDSGWDGRCDIRVNVDKRNLDGFLTLRAELLHRFEGKKLSVYPGHVDVLGDQAYDTCSCLARDDWASFALELARHWVFTRGGLHPADGADGTCVATRRQGFVVGPEGELYKCWTDVGRPSMMVGSIHAGETITDPVLVARYATGVDPYSDPRCRVCAVLPICGGGCAHRRLLAKYEGREDVDSCSLYRTRLQDCLESYIRVKRSRETCAALLRPGTTAEERPAWRVISPAPEQPPAPQGGARRQAPRTTTRTAKEEPCHKKR